LLVVWRGLTWIRLSGQSSPDGSGPGSEPATRLAFDDHRPCRPFAAACGHDLRTVARRRLFQQLGAHVFHRQIHQRCCDFGLLLKLVGQPPRCNNRFLERRRIVSHAPRAIFRFPDGCHIGYSRCPRPPRLCALQ